MPEPETPPAATPPASPATPPAATPPATPPAGGENDPVKMATELGELRKTKAEYDEYQKKVNPVLETLWSDPELLNKATEAHNKRLGVAPVKPATPAPGTPPISPQDSDTRNSQVQMIQERFETKVGIDKLNAEEQKTARGLVGQMLKEMVDPKGNKSMAQVFEEISLVKLPWYLEQAHKLINRDKDVAAAVEKGKNEVLEQYTGEPGVIGSVVGGSVPLDQVTLTPKEMQIADNMGIAHDVYLKNKKDILSARP